jgi:SAM-dependent methyltransferase
MNQDKIWERYQNDEELQDMGCRDGGRIEYIAKRVPENGCILNIGVGRGTPSETSIKRLRVDLSMGDRAKAGYSQNIPFGENYFDCVVMTEVLEHLSDEILGQTLSEVGRVLKPNGAFVGSVPADEKLIDGLAVCPHCGKQFHRWGHQQSFSRERLIKILRQNFEVAEIRRIVFLDWNNLNWKGKLSSAIRSIQAWLDRSGSNQNFFFLSRKPEA